MTKKNITIKIKIYEGGDNIKKESIEIMKIAGATVQEISEILGITKKSVYNKVIGATDFKMLELVLLAAHLRMSIDDLIREIEKERLKNGKER